MKHFLIGLFILLAATKLQAQEFFADEQNRDTIPKAFYEQKFHGTFCYTIGIKNYIYGGSLLIHYNKERFSPYFEFRFNPTSNISTDLVKLHPDTGAKAKNTIPTELPYRLINTSIGIATSPRKNVLIYANVGVRYAKALFNKADYPTYYIKPKDNELTVLFGGGAMYITPFGLTVQLGCDFSKFTIISGLGFTF